jgi:hypothetical protein
MEWERNEKSITDEEFIIIVYGMSTRDSFAHENASASQTNFGQRGIMSPGPLKFPKRQSRLN